MNPIHHRAGAVFDTDPARVDLDRLWGFLSTHAYWARWRTRDDVAAQLATAWRVVGVYEPASGEMIGFARAMSDGVAFAYLADVYVDPGHRGRGLGGELVRVMIDDGPGRGFRWMLHTADAHELYHRSGFRGPDPTVMERPGSHPAPVPAGTVALPSPGSILGDDVVVLRPWQDADRATVVAGLADPLFRRHARRGDVEYADAEARAFFESRRRGERAGVGLSFAIADRARPDAALGEVALHEVDLVAGTAGVGYWVAPGARGRGIAARAVRALSGWAFRDLGLARIALTCSPDNTASHRVAERAGFVREGVLRSHLVFQGGRRDSVVFSLLPTDLPPVTGTTWPTSPATRGRTCDGNG